MQTNVKQRAERQKTHEGAVARRDDPLTRLANVLNAHMLWEDQFYVDGKASADALRDAVLGAMEHDALATGNLIIDARVKMKLRHAPLWAAVQYALNNGPDARDLIFNVIQRADEMAEVLAMAGARKAPHAVMKGVRDVFENGRFDEYQLGKYRGEGKAVTMRDAVFLTHPDPVRAPLVQKVVDGTLAVPDTWETALSGGAEKRETFERLMSENRLGALALLRNLRGMLDAGVPRGLIEEALGMANWRTVLPFRFVNAARSAPEMAQALDKAFGKAVAGSVYLPGHTAVLLDTSGSMSASLSAKSTLYRVHAGTALAAAINGDQVTLIQWAERAAIVPNFGSLSTALTVHCGAVGHATFLEPAIRKAMVNDVDRIIVVSDMQFGDRDIPVVPTHVKGYTINVGSYRENGLIRGNWTHFTGFSEHVLKYIGAAEGGVK